MIGRTQLLALVLCACQAHAGWDLSSTRDLGELPGGATVWESHLTSGPLRAQLTGILFSTKNYRLAVADNPEPEAAKLADLAPRAGAVAGCNASYFHADWRPLGLVVAGGKPIHRQERAKLLSGILAVRDGKLELVRAGTFVGTAGVTEAIQAGPWLLESGRVVVGLDTIKRARRTLVATDGRGRWALATLSPVTLAEAAEILASGKAFPQWQPRSALNLDGGKSTALWAATPPTPLSIPEFGSVRNFLLLLQK